MIPFLYHGTATRVIPRIRQVGLQPRKPGTLGSWSKAMSGLGRIYLTDSYPLYYGTAAAGVDGRVSVLRINVSMLDGLDFLPDEDWVVHHTGASLKEARDVIAPGRPDLAEASLAGMGTVAHRGPIHKGAIDRVAHLTVDALCYLIMEGYDPVPGPANKKLLGTRYETMTRWLFDPDDTPLELDRTGITVEEF